MWGRRIINLSLNDSEKENPKVKLYFRERNYHVYCTKTVQYPGMKNNAPRWVSEKKTREGNGSTQLE